MQTYTESTVYRLCGALVENSMAQSELTELRWNLSGILLPTVYPLLDYKHKETNCFSMH